MSLFHAILLCVVLLGTNPASLEEQRIALAALEETLSSQPMLFVSYRVWFEKKGKNSDYHGNDLTETTCVWKRKLGMECFSESLNQVPPLQKRKWFYKGNITHAWSYLPKSSAVNGVTITPGPPKFELRSSNPLAFTLGYETFFRDGGLSAYLKTAQQKNSLKAFRSKQGFEISLGKHEVNGLQDEVMVTLDPTYDYRLVSWRLEQPTPSGQTIETWRFVSDEFQLVVDEITEERKWFPLRAHNETPTMVTRIAVDSVQINHEIPDDQFVSPNPPIGTKVRETSSTPGALPQISLIGGETARRQRLDELANQSRNELYKLDRQGVAYDATPPQTTSVIYLWIVGGSLLLLAGARWVSHRRR